MANGSTFLPFFRFFPYKYIANVYNKEIDCIVVMRNYSKAIKNEFKVMIFSSVTFMCALQFSFSPFAQMRIIHLHLFFFFFLVSCFYSLWWKVNFSGDQMRFFCNLRANLYWWSIKTFFWKNFGALCWDFIMLRSCTSH